MSFLQIAAAVLFAAMVAGSFEPHYVRILFADRAWLRAYYGGSADRGTPGYPIFLEQVRSRTRPGDSIAVLVPMSHWEGGYAYAYYRASYILAGRTIVPLVDPDDRKRLDRLNEADYAAVWMMNAEIPGYRPVWTGGDGFLAKRKAGNH